MNTLYIIKWMLSNGYEISRSCFWNAKAVKEKMDKNPEWEFTLVEANDIHIIWEAH